MYKDTKIKERKKKTKILIKTLINYIIKRASEIKLIRILMMRVQLVLRMDRRLKGILKDLRQSSRARRLNCRVGHVNNICGRSQIHSLE